MTLGSDQNATVRIWCVWRRPFGREVEGAFTGKAKSRGVFSQPRMTLEIELTQAEYDDLELLSQQRQQSVEDCGHDLLVEAVAAELEKTGGDQRPTKARWNRAFHMAASGRGSCLG
jgi:hypothetical protein